MNELANEPTNQPINHFTNKHDGLQYLLEEVIMTSILLLQVTCTGCLSMHHVAD